MQKLSKLILLLLLFSFAKSTRSHADAAPNILLIISDDQRYDQLDYMPKTKELIFSRGLNFSKAYVTTPSCCPSRSSIFTGNYTSKHAVKGNRYVLNQRTVSEILKQNGYFTGLVGKFLNTSNGFPATGFDYWIGFKGGSALYNDPVLNVQGQFRQVFGYITDILKDYVLEFINQSSLSEKPFFLVFSPNAPHWPAIPAVQDKTLYSNLPPFRPASYDEADKSDKPAWVRKIPLTPTHIKEQTDLLRIAKLRTLASLDRSIEEIIQTLQSKNLLANTLVIFISDNGVMLLEHGLRDKDTPYEEAIHVPFAIRYDPIISTPRIASDLVANIDITPTILDIAGITIPGSIDGKSLKEVMQGGSLLRNEILLESWRTKGEDGGSELRIPFAAIHTGFYKYIRNKRELSELYDLNNDPFELNNLVKNSDYKVIKEDLSKRLKALLKSVRNSTSFSKPKGEKLPDGKFHVY
ncbi:MAG: sulfatase-like hydrolase/transferase [bacterium]|nr:sulfatase-like hydrolase/transferase [bacterium]